MAAKNMENALILLEKHWGASGHVHFYIVGKLLWVCGQKCAKTKEKNQHMDL